MTNFLISLRLHRGQTALHKAVENQHRKICYMLVAAGANLNMRDANGQTPMMLAFQADDHDLAAYLESMWLPHYPVFTHTGK